MASFPRPRRRRRSANAARRRGSANAGTWSWKSCRRSQTRRDEPMTALLTPAAYAARDVDLHVHTLTSACGYTSHRRLLELTRAAGRRVLAVTDHDSARGGVTVRELAARTGDDVLVLVGMELTTSDLGHMILFGRGVEDEWGWKKGSPFPTHIPDHWVAIQAH